MARCSLGVIIFITLWLAISVGKSIFKKQFWGKVWALTSANIALIMGKQASAASV